MLSGILSVATDPVQQGNWTENPRLYQQQLSVDIIWRENACSYAHFLSK